MLDHREIGVFASLEECRAIARKYLQDLDGGEDAGDYECGKNCKFKPDMSIEVCEATER
ncbi:MAG: hypothetical protein IPJ11_10875 [Gemmatimonadetes bacterium]|nr:hypothetical protein [Gemmatimonadota bacterium]